MCVCMFVCSICGVPVIVCSLSAFLSLAELHFFHCASSTGGLVQPSCCSISCAAQLLPLPCALSPTAAMLICSGYNNRYTCVQF